MPTNDDKEDSIVVGVINQLINRVETLEKGIHEKQKTFEESMVAQFTALRQDSFASYLDLKIKFDTHEQRHITDDRRAENDTLARAHRQFTLNLILFGLGFIMIVGFVVIGFVIVLRGT